MADLSSVSPADPAPLRNPPGTLDEMILLLDLIMAFGQVSVTVFQKKLPLAGLLNCFYSLQPTTALSVAISIPR